MTMIVAMITAQPLPIWDKFPQGDYFMVSENPKFPSGPVEILHHENNHQPWPWCYWKNKKARSSGLPARYLPESVRLIPAVFSVN
jgi:hypothetical protein